MSKHFLDKPILRGWFWFIVLPYNLKQWLKEKEIQLKIAKKNKEVIEHE